MNKNLLRVIVYGVDFLIFVGLLQLINPMISFKTHTIFTPMGIVWFITAVLIISLSNFGGNFILRKYGAQITTPKEKKTFIIILLAIAVVSFDIFAIILYFK